MCHNGTCHGPLAQWLERGTHNALVVGSIPTRPTMNQFIDNSPYVDSIYTMQTLILNFIPTAKFGYDAHGQVIIYTDLMTDDDGNLIPFKL